MKTTCNISTSFLHFSLRFIFLALLLSLSLAGCTRSPWIKADGHEVPPEGQLKCAHHVQQHSKEGVLEQKVIKEEIEQCMLNEGYKRRPWWLLNDSRWT